MRDVYTVGECCPLGCLAVILVKRATDSRVFAWCSTCGLAWADPMHGPGPLGDYGASELHASAIADGAVVALATKADVEWSGWAAVAHRVAARQDWPSPQIDDYNKKYGCEGE